MAEPLAAVQGEISPVADFSSWMISEQRRIFLLCLRMLQDAEDADSATQDSFLKAYRAFQKQHEVIDDPSKWMTRIAVNTCLDRLRSKRWQFWRKRPNSEDEKIILEMTAESSPNAEDMVFAGQIRDRLAVALGNLSERQRAVFTLRHYDGRSLEEIADILSLDVGTVKAHMARALAKLRIHLRDLYDLQEGGRK